MMNVAIIGCGKRGDGKVGWAIGYAHAGGWLNSGHSVLLHAVDISPENLAAFGVKFAIPKERLFSSTEDLYAKIKPDFVSVCTWPGLHERMVIEAASHGVRGIACEKPVATSMGAIRKMLATCAKANVCWVVAHQRRYEPRFQLARELLQQGVIGKKWCLEARVGDDWDILSWTVHWFDMANFLFDAIPQSVLAGVDDRGERRYEHAVEHGSVVFAQYPGERQAMFITGPSVVSPGEIVIRGEKGMLVVGATIQTWTESGFKTHTPQTASKSNWENLMGDLASAAGSDRPLLCDAQNTAIATEMALAAHESARTMRCVTLPLAANYPPLEVARHEPVPDFPANQVVLFADEHFGSGGREGLADALNALCGKSPLIIDAAAQGLDSAALKGVDLLVLYHTQEHADEATQQLLKDWVGRKMPLLLVHAALGAYPKWDEYQKWIGRAWIWGDSEHPHQDSEILVHDSLDRGPGWKSAWLPRDEVFIKLGLTSSVDDLLSVRSSSGIYPAGWVNHSQRNIGVFVPGHLGDMWGLPVIRQALAAIVRQISKSPTSVRT